jgi:hypothetical protein
MFDIRPLRQFKVNKNLYRAFRPTVNYYTFAFAFEEPLCHIFHCHRGDVFDSSAVASQLWLCRFS